MAETAKNDTENNPMTSSDLGSSCENDVDLSVASDVKCKLRSDDGISFDGSVSLTLDSLEEEEEIIEEEEEIIEEEEEKCSGGLSKREPMNTNASNFSGSEDSLCLQESARTETHRKKYKVSDLAVHSGQKLSKSGHRHANTSAHSSTKDADSEPENAFSETGELPVESERKTNTHLTNSEAKNDASNSKESFSLKSDKPVQPDENSSKRENKVQHDRNSSESVEHDISSSEPEKRVDGHSRGVDRRDSRTSDTIHEESNTPAPAAGDARPSSLSLRKASSLTEESSTDPSPKLCRRSAIPRRRSADQSGTMTTTATLLSSSTRSTPRGTPRHSPRGVRRSLTLNSADFAPSSDALPRTSQARVRRSLTLTSADFGHTRASGGSNSGGSSPSGITSPASFPSSPVKVRGGGRLRRSASQCDNISVCSESGCYTGIPANKSKETVTSRLRFEKHHHDHEQGHPEASETYLTPSQRKDQELKDLRQRLKELVKQLEGREREVERLRDRMEDEREQAKAKLREELEEARALAETARKEVTSLKESHEESVKTVATLQQQLEDVKKEKADKLAQAEEIFLEMYNKGRESAIFEREEEIELQSKGGRSSDATETDLRNKLVRTQAELAKWQTIQRHESYHTTPIPGTEAETTLRFLKDSFFHFLTADKKTEDEHLRAIVRILRFSEIQREKIAKAIIHKRNKSGW